MFSYFPNNSIALLIFSAIAVYTLYWLVKQEKTQYLIYALLVWFPLESLILLYTPTRYYSYVKYFPEILIYGLFVGAWIYYFKKNHRLIPRQPVNKWLVIFLGVAFVSLIINHYNLFVWSLGVRQILRFVLIFFVMLFMRYPSDIWRKFLLIGGAMIGLEAVLGLIQYALGGRIDQYLFSAQTVTVGGSSLLAEAEMFWAPGSRVFATLGRYDRLGSLLALGLIVLFPWKYYLKNNQQKIWYWSAMVVGAICLLFTLSRASWLAAFFGILVIGGIINQDKKVWWAVAVLFLGVSAYLTGFALARNNLASITEKPNQSLAERVFEAVSYRAWRESYDGNGRAYFIINTPRRIIADKPFFGVGPGRFGGGVAAALLNTSIYDKYLMPFGIQNIYGQIDNNWFSIWGETGTLGLISWAMIFLTLIYMGVWVWPRLHHIDQQILAQGLVGLTVGIIILGFFGPYFEFRALMFYFWIVAGIVAGEWMGVKYRGDFLHDD